MRDTKSMFKKREREISEKAYRILKQGTILVKNKKFYEAYEKYIEARNLFNKISWKREVSQIDNELLFKLKRENKVPLITIDEIDDVEYSSTLVIACKALDMAYLSIIENELRKAVSELIEAKFHFKVLNTNEKIIKQIDNKIFELQKVIAKNPETTERYPESETDTLKARIAARREARRRRRNGNDRFPYPYIFKPPSPPGDITPAGQPQAEDLVKKEEPEYESHCKHCGAKLPKGQLICHVCGKKVI